MIDSLPGTGVRYWRLRRSTQQQPVTHISLVGKYDRSNYIPTAVCWAGPEKDSIIYEEGFVVKSGLCKTCVRKIKRAHIALTNILEEVST